MRLLFVKLKHIGDSLLLTPTLAAARQAYPQAEIRVVVRRGCESILAGCSAIDRVHITAAPEARNRSPAGDVLRDVNLLLELRRWQPDYAFELGGGGRGRLLACLSGARLRYGQDTGHPVALGWRKCFQAFSKPDGHLRHRAEQDYEVVNQFLPLVKDVPPLVFEAAKAAPWPPATSLPSFAVIHPGTRWVRKRWPVAQWIELGHWLLPRVPHLIISAGPDPEEIQSSQHIQSALGNRVLTTAGQTSWAQLASLLYRARLFVGVDTAAMHLAAACQCPVVAIFGETSPVEWHPWKVRHRLVMASPETRAGVPRERLTALVQTNEVITACEALLSETEGAPRKGLEDV